MGVPAVYRSTSEIFFKGLFRLLMSRGQGADSRLGVHRHGGHRKVLMDTPSG